MGTAIVSRQVLHCLSLGRGGDIFPSCFAILRDRTKTGPQKARASNLSEKKTLKGEEGSTMESWQAGCPEARARGSMREAESKGWQAGRKRLAEGLLDPLSCVCHSHVD